MPRPRDEYNPFAAPKSDLSPDEFELVEDEERAIRYASFWQRFVAAFADGILLRILQAVTSFAVENTLAANLGNDVVLIVALVNILLSWLYYAAQESSNAQATLGKRALGIQLRAVTGERVGFGRASARYFSRFFALVPLFLGTFLGEDPIARALLVVGFILLFADFLIQPFTPRRQTVHDMISGVVVVVKR